MLLLVVKPIQYIVDNVLHYICSPLLFLLSSDPTTSYKYLLSSTTGPFDNYSHSILSAPTWLSSSSTTSSLASRPFTSKASIPEFQNLLFWLGKSGPLMPSYASKVVENWTLVLPGRMDPQSSTKSKVKVGVDDVSALCLLMYTLLRECFFSEEQLGIIVVFAF